MAGPAFDAFISPVEGTGTFTFNYTPVGTAKGIYVSVIQYTGASSPDEISGITFGGIAMAEVNLSPLLKTAGTEDGVIYGYFLGTGIPTGVQQIIATATGSSPKRICAVGVTAAGDTAIDTTGTLNSGGTTNPAVVLTATTDVFVFGALLSGEGNPASMDKGADFTQLVENDFGAGLGCFQRRTANAAAGSVTVDWVCANSEVAGILAVAIKDVAAAGAGQLTPRRRMKTYLRM